MVDRSAAPRLSDLTWSEAADWFRHDPRLMLPVGTCLQHGPHLPLGTDALISAAVADGIGACYRVLVAPTFRYGAGSRRERDYAGTAVLREKTLHRVLNELVSCWEDQGVEEVVLLTAQGHWENFNPMMSVISERARIRAVDLNAVDLGDFLTEPDRHEHGGELETSLVLYLAPELVRRDAMRDAPLSERDGAGVAEGSEAVPPPGSPGVVGRPSAASRDKGEAIYAYLVEYIGDRLFGEARAGLGADRSVGR